MAFSKLFHQKLINLKSFHMSSIMGKANWKNENPSVSIPALSWSKAKISFEIRGLLNDTLFNVPSSPSLVPYMPPIKQCFDIDYNSFSVLLLLFPWQPDHTRPPKLLGKVLPCCLSSTSFLLFCFQSHLDMSEMERSPNLRAAIWKCILNYIFFLQMKHLILHFKENMFDSLLIFRICSLSGNDDARKVRHEADHIPRKMY